MTGDHRAWWIPAYQPNRYEYRYTDSPLSRTEKVHTPITFQTKDGLYLSLHEAALTDFASMALWRKDGNTFQADLVPWSDGVKVRHTADAVAVAHHPDRRHPRRPDRRYLILNLNEPCKLEDTSWIKPGKYVGIWWEMHLGKSTWGPRGPSTAPPRRTPGATSTSPRSTASTACWSRAGTSAGTATGPPTATSSASRSPIPTTTSRPSPKYAKKKGVR
jgi:hypothetical protein